MDETGNHHSQQTDKRMENQTLHVLIHMWMLNNENTWTHDGEHNIPGLVGGWGLVRDSRVSGDWGGITLREIPNVDDGGMNAVNHHGMCIPM